MSLSDCSNVSDLSNGETVYSLEDLLNLNIIDQTVAEWITAHPLPEDDLLLLLEYRDPDIAAGSDHIAAALVNNRATQVSPTVFQFTNRDDMDSAREAMLDTHLWAFYEPQGSFVAGHRLNQPFPFVLLRQNQTILTKVISFYSESKFTVQEIFQFFKY